MEKYLVKVARESFKGVMAFKNEKDLEGLRHFVSSNLLNDWINTWKKKQEFSYFSNVKVADCKMIHNEGATFTVEFTGEWTKQSLKNGRPSETTVSTFVERWTFERESERWILETVSEVSVAQAQQKKTHAS